MAPPGRMVKPARIPACWLADGARPLSCSPARSLERSDAARLSSALDATRRQTRRVRFGQRGAFRNGGANGSATPWLPLQLGPGQAGAAAIAAHSSGSMAPFRNGGGIGSAAPFENGGANWQRGAMVAAPARPRALRNCSPSPVAMGCSPLLSRQTESGSASRSLSLHQMGRGDQLRTSVPAVRVRSIDSTREREFAVAKVRIVKSEADVTDLRSTLRVTAEHARNQLRVLVGSEDVLERLKFERLGCDPLDVDDAQNLAEQIDQQATYEVGVDALEILMRQHPGLTWRFAPGAQSAGHDIAADDDSVIAEVFAAVSPKNGNKLEKDLAKVYGSPAAHRYVIYRSPSASPAEVDILGIKIISLGPAKRR